MLYESALPILLPLALSYLLTYYASRNRRSRTIPDFLFEGNRPTLAISSTIGSVFSLSIAGTALLSAGFVYGWQIVFPLATGALSGTLVLIHLQRSPLYQSFAPREGSGLRETGISYLACLSTKLGVSFHIFFSVALLFLYLLMLVMELSVLRVLLVKALSLDAFDLHVLIAAIVIICFCYVYVGGYHGILLTDHFQLFVILLFFALFLSMRQIPAAVINLPAPAASLIQWNSWLRVAVLHFSVFSGSFCFATTTVDHWNRTLGTLPPSQSRPVLIRAAVLASIGAIILILIGSYATRLDLPPGISNSVSLELTARVLAGPNLTLRFTLLMALTCIVLTTIDTYMISLQQIYYELSIRMHATSHKLYLLEWLIKWPQIRGVGGLMTAIALIISLLVGSQAIYFFGVLTLSGWTFFLPVIAVFFIPLSWRVAPHMLQSGLKVSFVLSLALFALLLTLVNSYYAPVPLHLYLICGTALVAVLISTGLVILIYWLMRRAFSS